MKSNNIFTKILIVFLIFTTVNFSPVSYAVEIPQPDMDQLQFADPGIATNPVLAGGDPLGVVGDAVGTVIETMTTIVESIVVRITLHLGDGLLFFVSKSVGEVVSIDAIVYNSVDKLNINYWDNGGTGVKTFFKGVINKWYKAFYKIAIIVYMAVLVVAGIQILLHSTAEKTAKYKEYLVSWITRSRYIVSFPLCDEIYS